MLCKVEVAVHSAEHERDRRVHTGRAPAAAGSLAGACCASPSCDAMPHGLASGSWGLWVGPLLGPALAAGQAWPKLPWGLHGGPRQIYQATDFQSRLTSATANQSPRRELALFELQPRSSSFRFSLSACTPIRLDTR